MDQKIFADADVLYFSMNRYTVGKITPEPKHEICPNDFGSHARIHMNFPRGGTPLTPTHDSSGFKWKDYCPMVFRCSISLLAACISSGCMLLRDDQCLIIWTKLCDSHERSLMRGCEAII
jgi:hypothetical protein